MTKIVTAKEVGEYLKLSDSTVYKLASIGEIPGFKIGDSWRFDMDEILRLIRGSKKTLAPREKKKDGKEKR
jgi:excisionase family DNA binding protein